MATHMIDVSNLAFVDPLLVYGSVSNIRHTYSITIKFGFKKTARSGFLCPLGRRSTVRVVSD